MPAGARARKRAEQARLAALAAQQRERAAARRERRAAVVRRLTGWIPRRRRRPEGLLAARGQRRLRITVALLVGVNVVVWLMAPSWSARALAVVASILVAPVLYTVLFRRD